MLAKVHQSKIDSLWLQFHSGGVTNPITVIEQISYLMFARLLDLTESLNENRASRLGRPFSGTFSPQKQHLRWKNFRNLGGAEMLVLVRDEFFPFMRSEIVQQSALGSFLSDANCLIPSGNLLVQAVNAIEELPLNDSDTKGDLYEHLLSKLSTAGIAGQFRTPRHIIRTMVEMVQPKPDETVCDPACGTGGFLVGTIDHLKQTYSSPELVTQDPLDDGQTVTRYPGDLLEPYLDHVRNHMLRGFDFDQTMLRIAAMNLLLHGIESPCIRYQDTLGASFIDRNPHEAADCFDVILANPPFKGTIDFDNMDPTLRSKVKTSKSELLFVVLILRMLAQGGRAAVIVPDGVLFGSSNAHESVRRMIVEDNQLEAVISLPGGVFKPYAGVSTAILIFTKGGRTDHVWFYDVQGDGFSLDDKRTAQPDKDDLPDLVAEWKKRDTKAVNDRTARRFFVTACEIKEKNFDLSLNRYKETVHTEAAYEHPKVILAKLKELEHSIIADLNELEGMLG